MKKQKKMQVVEDDEIENVGIMQGFMDDLDGMMAEIDEEMMASEQDETARLMGRTPDSPEVLMNNLRGDYRSIDARREELADLVGYNSAAETPDEVLALLQPVLAQQGVAALPALSPPPVGQPPLASTPPGPPGGVASLPTDQGPMPPAMPPAMPPMGMADGGIVERFMEADKRTRARRAAEQEARIARGRKVSDYIPYPGNVYPALENIVTDVPKGIASLVRGEKTEAPQGALLTEAEQYLQAKAILSNPDSSDRERAFAQATVSSLRPTSQGGNMDNQTFAEMLQQIDKIAAAKAPVQNFQDGSDEAGVTSVGSYSPETIAEANRQILELLRGRPSASTVDVMARTRELAPQYAELLGTGDKNAARSQMLFDIAQGALRFAGNVGSQGQPLRGSFAARLAGATEGLPAQVGARVAEMRKGEQAARLAALQAAQGEQQAAVAANTADVERRQQLLKEIAKQKPGKSYRFLTDEEKRQLPEADRPLPWQIEETTGELSLQGGRPPSDKPLVDMGENTLEKVGVTELAQGLTNQYNAALAAAGNIRKIDETIKLLAEGNVDSGFGAEFRQNIRRIQTLFSDDPTLIDRLSDTELLNSALGKEVFGAITALGVGARGLDTPAEREFLREVVAGRIQLTKETLMEMARIRRRAEENSIMLWNETLASGRADPLIEVSRGMLPDEPLPIPVDPSMGKRDEPSDVRSRVNQLLGRG